MYFKDKSFIQSATKSQLAGISFCRCLLDFSVMLQKQKDKKELADVQKSNHAVMYNLLPSHVALHFLDKQVVAQLVRLLLAYK